MSDNNNININTPEIGPYTHLQPFRFWCQKVLPLVYDESLSYYELLCKVVDYLNKTMEDVDQMITDMGDFHDAYNEFATNVRDTYIAFSREVEGTLERLEDYMDNYFDNLDVQQEINNKLDAMAEAGYFSDLFNTLFRTDVINAAQIVTANWISQNLLQETGYVIDNSLSVANAAADAKATGDALTELDITIKESALYLSDNDNIFEAGNINVVDGTNTTDTLAYRTISFIDKSIIKVDFDTASYVIRILLYDKTDGSYIGVWKDGNITQTTVSIDKPTFIYELQESYDIRLCFFKNGNVMSDSDLNYIYLYNSLIKKAPTDYIGFDALTEKLQDSLTPGIFEEAEVAFGAENRYINVNNGVISDAGAINAHVSGYINCSDMKYIRYTGSSYYAFGCLAFYTQNKTFIKAYPAASGNINYWLEEIPVPENAYYVVFEDNSNISGKLAVTVEYMTTFSAILTRNLINKKWVCMGDSHTEINDRASLRYMDYIQMETGIKPVNMGLSGTGYANRHAEGLAFIDRVEDIPTDADVVTIYGSFNDVFSANPLPLGDVTDSGTTTLCGFINGTIDALYTHFIRCNLGIITPCPWENANPANTTSDASKYVDAIVEICKRRGIPCLDLFHCSGLRPWESAYRAIYYSKDDGNGVHPNELGHALIAPRIKEFINSLIM